MELIVAAIVGLATGVFVGWLAARLSHARLRAELDTARAIHVERLKAYQEAEARLREAFQALSADALNANNQAFLHLAETRLGRARTEATADIDDRKNAIEHLLAPMKTTLEQVDREIKDSERRRQQHSTELIQKIASLDTVGQTLRVETARLVDALKRPGVRGRWGEMQLKRVLEFTGMVEHCHFTEQQTLDAGDEGRFRPDVVVQLPGGKRLVIDAKVPLDAYLKALEAPDEEARQRLLADHARQVRTHLSQLAAKSYAAHVQPSPDFVVMFLPGEMFFSAALEQDPGLILEERVIVASPTTLIALLRTVAYGWQQEAVARDARQIAELGRKLYDAVGKLAEHFERLGSRLRGSVEAYNDAIGSLEGNVLVKARRFKELQAANSEDIARIEPIDKTPRMLQAAEITDGLPFQDAEVADEEAEPVS